MSRHFRPFQALPIPLLRDNIDTDQIIPSREMQSTAKSGFADGLFAGHRYLDDKHSDGNKRIPNPDFVLNKPQYADSSILLSGANFGCGSSREHAVWALVDYGIRAIIAASFAPIFEGNCARNGLLAIVLPQEAIAHIAAAACEVTVDLAEQRVALVGDGRAKSQTDGCQWTFAIDSEAKVIILEGLDSIDLSLKMVDKIAAWQRADRIARPWIYFA